MTKGLSPTQRTCKKSFSKEAGWVHRYLNLCNLCEKAFHPHRRKQKFCSLYCAVRGRGGKTAVNQVSAECFNCKVEYKKMMSKISSSKFCSRKCQMFYRIEKYKGVENPNWRGGKSFESYSSNWVSSLKQKIRKKYQNKCQLCHKKQIYRSLAVHHIDYDKNNCVEENLIALCDKCHGWTNANRGCWEMIFKNLKLGYGKIKFITYG